MTSAALAAAQFEAALWSTLAAWLLVVIAIPLALTFSSTWPVVIERTIQWIEAEGTLRAVAIVLLVFLGLFGLTWRQLVQNLYIGLTGREWIVKSSVLFALACSRLRAIAVWILSLYVMALATNALPWIAAACRPQTFRRCRDRHAARAGLLRPQALPSRTVGSPSCSPLRRRMLVTTRYPALLWRFPRSCRPPARLSRALALAGNRHGGVEDG